MKKILVSLLAIAGLASLLVAGPINKTCPFSGKAINASKTATVGFCCGKCCGAAAKSLKAGGEKAKEFLASVKADNKGGTTINKTCPKSGKALGKPTLTVAFCCGNCLGKFTGKK